LCHPQGYRCNIFRASAVRRELLPGGRGATGEIPGLGHALCGFSKEALEHHSGPVGNGLWPIATCKLFEPGFSLADFLRDQSTLDLLEKSISKIISMIKKQRRYSSIRNFC